MAAIISTFSILLVSLLSVFTTKCIAFPSIPLSCLGPDPVLQKCARDCGSAIKAAYVSTKPHISGTALNVALESIHAARAAGISAVKFLSSIHSGLINENVTKDWVITLKSTIRDAERELNQASKVIGGETKLASTKLQSVEKSLKVAAGITSKLHTQVGFKQTIGDTNGLLDNLTKQFIDLTNLTIKVIRELKQRGKPSED